ncbi:MAG TPA: MarR family transcriptional regulator [Mycobacteriales bacterium]|nr:MarR family transcriptional regulator [Mycobacteriales bacterium]
MAVTAAAREAWRTIRDLLMSGPGHDMFIGACTSEGLTPGPAKALLRLHDQPSQSMRDLAALLGCDASYVTALTDQLEEKGFAERRPHPSDRRARIVVLTDAGEQAALRLLDALSVPPDAFAALTAAEQATLRDLMRKVAAVGDAPQSRTA